MPPRFEFELRLGPYKPNVANSSAVHDVYDKVYTDKSMFAGRPLMLGAETDWYFLRTAGLLGLYGRVGWWHADGPTRLCRDANNVIIRCDDSNFGTSEKGVDHATLTIIPVSVGLVYRMDLLKRRFGIPLLFSAKAGLDYHLWWAKSGSDASKYKGKPARGGTLGYSAALGAAFSLSGLQSKSSFSSSRSGVSEYYLFAEYDLIRGRSLDSKKNRFDMTPTKPMVVVGFLIDF